MAPNAQLGSKNRSDKVDDFNSKYENKETEPLKGVEDGLLSGGKIFGDVSGSAGPSERVT